MKTTVLLKCQSAIQFYVCRSVLFLAKFNSFRSEYFSFKCLKSYWKISSLFLSGCNRRMHFMTSCHNWPNSIFSLPCSFPQYMCKYTLLKWRDNRCSQNNNNSCDSFVYRTDTISSRVFLLLTRMMTNYLQGLALLMFKDTTMYTQIRLCPRIDFGFTKKRCVQSFQYQGQRFFSLGNCNSWN